MTISVFDFMIQEKHLNKSNGKFSAKNKLSLKHYLDDAGQKQNSPISLLAPHLSH